MTTRTVIRRVTRMVTRIHRIQDSEGESDWRRAAGGPGGLRVTVTVPGESDSEPEPVTRTGPCHRTRSVVCGDSDGRDPFGSQGVGQAR